MLNYTIRRLMFAVPTLLFISLVIFLLLELAPGDPMAQVPLTVPPLSERFEDVPEVHPRHPADGKGRRRPYRRIVKTPIMRHVAGFFEQVLQYI